jgi:hypothetical protein
MQLAKSDIYQQDREYKNPMKSPKHSQNSHRMLCKWCFLPVENFPAARLTCVVNVMSEYFPATQTIQVDAEMFEYDPEGHPLHDAAPELEYFPPMQSVHVVTALPETLYFPAGNIYPPDIPELGQYDPPPHMEQEII